MRMLLALFAVRTVNLRELAVGFISEAQVDSRCQRIKQFFRQFTIARDKIGRWLFSLFYAEQQQVYVTLDRTNLCLKPH